MEQCHLEIPYKYRATIEFKKRTIRIFRSEWSEFFLESRKNKNGTGSYSFSSDNYMDGKCGSGHTLTRNISTSQGNTYDGARKNMGEPWKILTDSNGYELINNATHKWTSMGMINGMKFISKTDTSKYIFLPAGGHWHYDVWGNLNYNWNGSKGYYWSNKYSKSSFAYYMEFDNDSIPSWDDGDGINQDYYWRSNGSSIRPVAPKRPW